MKRAEARAPGMLARPIGLFVLHHLLKVARLFAALFALWLTCSPALAHNPDTSYTKVKIFPEGMEFKFTFDVFTLLKIVQLDENRDHQVTLEELRSKSPLLERYIHEHIRVRLDEQEPEWEAGEPPVFSENLTVTPEKDYHQTLVHFVFHRELLGVPELLSIDFHVFDSLGERHMNLATVEELNNPLEEIIFTRFEPSYDYYTNTPQDLTRQLTQFFQLGVKHIFFGYDHLLFLVALILVGRLLELVKIITAFTVAHCITLLVAALGYIHPPTRWVEAGIAATIMYVAVENIVAKETAKRWRLTFVFGLVHGLGFATVLQKMSLPTTGLVKSLISFNVGVEVAQIGMVLLLFPVVHGISEHKMGRIFKVAASGVIFLCGSVWFWQRVAG